MGGKVGIKGQIELVIGIVVSNIVLLIASFFLAFFYQHVEAGPFIINPILPLGLAGLLDIVVIIGFILKELSG
ncbi:hypothetical protein AKJ39_03140 [candidate division MSBL1 archaeon SCGC-AAA259J03]|uniref:Uncharacterized protein n=1 Tax=candidate division MSBL1 archaeon SCGC-AAA259J03 TaxID=1698269 RepID=A0A656YW62_9EURY|nr:hypothetical protein AKJ39_03140 [candidate division MSBL1 archaeon SCGC-AAA259J03]